MRPPHRTTALAGVGFVLALAVGCSGSSDIAQDNPTSSGTTSGATTNTTPPTAPASTTPTEATTPTVSATTPPDHGSRLAGTGYSVAIPKGWADITKSLESRNPQLDVAMGDLAAQGFRTNFNVVNTGSPPGTIEDDGPAIRKEAAAELKKVTKAAVTPLPDRSIDGEAAIGQTSTFVTDGTRVTFRQYLVIHDDQAFPITMTFAASDKTKAIAQLAQILATWRWDS